MIGIAMIVLSCVAAVLGITHSHAAEEADRSYKGLTRLGVGLIALATLGMTFGVIKEVAGIRGAQRAAEAEAQRTELLKEMHTDIAALADGVDDPVIAGRLVRLRDGIAAAASSAREGDFSLSDFSRSDFTAGNFTQASFRDALFDQADLSGAALSTAIVDADTRLPTP